MSTVEVEVYALSEMNTALRVLNEAVREALDGAERAIQDELDRLQRVEQERMQEVAACQAAYEQCRAQVDEDGHSPPCTAELQQLHAAEEALRQVQEQRKRFTDQADQYRRQASRAQASVDSVLPDARAYLEKHIESGLHYLRGHPDEVGSIAGTGDHGSRYQSARREWFQRGASGELREEGRELQGWMRQEVNRGSYRSPYRAPGAGTTSYHVGHFVGGVDVPENFRWELSRDNMVRAHAARQYNLPRTYF